MRLVSDTSVSKKRKNDVEGVPSGPSPSFSKKRKGGLDAAFSFCALVLLLLPVGLLCSHTCFAAPYPKGPKNDVVAHKWRNM